MVSTRSAGNKVARDENRIIAIVTGANSGFGLAICHLLLSSLSLPPGSPIPLSTPEPTALGPNQKHLLSSTSSADPLSTDINPDIAAKATETIDLSSPPTMTLVLACRSGVKATEAIKIVRSRHEKELARRRRKGIEVRKGWLEGLRIVWEKVDLDSVGGSSGVLAFCERIKENYPHITSLFLNAGFVPAYGLDYLGFAKQILRQGLVESCTHPVFQLQRAGVLSSDGERGKTWGTNVLAPYIMAKELFPLLDMSPPSLPLPPRIIYTSSYDAEYRCLKPDAIDEDYELLTYDVPYQASKYLGDVVFQHLDQEYNVPREGGEKRLIRILPAEPGIVATNIANAGLGAWQWLVTVQWSLYWVTIYIVRLLGSKKHPTFPREGALPLLYAAMIPDKYLQSPSKVPGQKFQVLTRRFKGVRVAYGEIDEWVKAKEEGLGKKTVERCEVVRREWRRREGLE